MTDVTLLASQRTGNRSSAGSFGDIVNLDMVLRRGLMVLKPCRRALSRVESKQAEERRLSSRACRVFSGAG
jgi:hypothetical protein